MLGDRKRETGVPLGKPFNATIYTAGRSACINTVTTRVRLRARSAGRRPAADSQLFPAYTLMEDDNKLAFSEEFSVHGNRINQVGFFFRSVSFCLERGVCGLRVWVLPGGRVAVTDHWDCVFPLRLMELLLAAGLGYLNTRTHARARNGTVSLKAAGSETRGPERTDRHRPSPELYCWSSWVQMYFHTGYSFIVDAFISIPNEWNGCFLTGLTRNVHVGIFD